MSPSFEGEIELSDLDRWKTKSHKLFLEAKKQAALKGVKLKKKDVTIFACEPLSEYGIDHD